jgi:hypothetical protein
MTTEKKQNAESAVHVCMSSDNNTLKYGSRACLNDAPLEALLNLSFFGRYISRNNPHLIHVHTPFYLRSVPLVHLDTARIVLSTNIFIEYRYTNHTLYLVYSMLSLDQNQVILHILLKCIPM